jgi:hypothetical protein
LAGHYSSAFAADLYYSRLAEDLDRAFRNGTLPEDDSLVLLGMRLPHDALGRAAMEMPGAVGKLMSFGGCEPILFLSEGPLLGVVEFQRFTGSRMAPVEGVEGRVPDLNVPQNLKRRYWIWIAYRRLTPIFTIAGAVVLARSLGLCLSRRQAPPLLILATSIPISVFVLLAGLCLIQVSSFPAVNSMYLAPLYPLAILFPALSGVLFYQCSVKS